MRLFLSLIKECLRDEMSHPIVGLYFRLVLAEFNRALELLRWGWRCTPMMMMMTTTTLIMKCYFPFNGSCWINTMLVSVATPGLLLICPLTKVSIKFSQQP